MDVVTTSFHAKCLHFHCYDSVATTGMAACMDPRIRNSSVTFQAPWETSVSLFQDSSGERCLCRNMSSKFRRILRSLGYNVQPVSTETNDRHLAHVIA